MMNKALNPIFGMLRLLKIPKDYNFGALRVYIILAMVGNVAVILRSFEFFEFIFPLEHRINAYLVKCCLVFWFLLSLLVIYKPKWVWLGVLNLFISGFFLRSYLTYGIFESTHLCISWGVLFSMLTLEHSNDKGSIGFQIGSVGMFFSILFFGLIFWHAGYDKLLDPYWQNGIGFKNFIELEWIVQPEIRSFFSNSGLLLFAGNYFAMASEILFLFLFLIPKTRVVAFVLYVPMGVQLFFPFNIFLIGYFALIYVLFVGIVTFAKGELTYDSGYRILIIPVTWLLILLSFAHTAINWTKSLNNQYKYSNKADYLPSGFEYDFARSDFAGAGESWRRELLKFFHLHEAYNPYSFVFKRWLRKGPIALFSGRHTVGIFGFRLVLIEPNGHETEPRSFFEEDGSRSVGDSQLLQLNIFQGSMYTFTDLIYLQHSLDVEDFRKIYGQKYKTIMNPITQFVAKEYPDSNQLIYKFYVKSLGQDCPSDLSNWKPFIVIDSENITIKSIEIEHCDQGRDYRLANYFSLAD